MSRISAGDTIMMALSLTNTTGYQMSAVSTDIIYDMTRLESPSVAIGPTGSAAEKNVSFYETTPGTFRLGVFSASNNTIIENGVVAYVSFRIKNTATMGDTTLSNSPSGADPAGNDVFLDGANGTVSISTADYLYVSRDANCGTHSQCYTKIQDAIDAATNGTTILVKQGTYQESLTVSGGKSILIKGDYDSVEYDQCEPNTTFLEASGQTTIQASNGSSLRLEQIIARITAQ
jgi:hypothetical protein